MEWREPWQHYVVTKAAPKTYGVSLEELWFGDGDKEPYVCNNTTNTVTRLTGHKILLNTYRLQMRLLQFNAKYKSLSEVDRHSLYRTFYVPKSSGGLREINAPKAELMDALNELKTLLENEFGARYLYHTSAFAYIHGRSTVTCVKKHQANASKFFGKFDVHNFFGSTTLDWVMFMFAQVFPFSQLFETVMGRDAFKDAISLCFLDGVLPQGTPISPLITNIMMIPVDYWMEKWCRENGLVYSRYADDFLISSRAPFMFKEVESYISDTFKKFGAPFSLNTRKTRYGSSAGANWNFGIMLNKDNKLSIGRAKKRQFESMLAAYAKDRRNGTEWSLEDVQHLDGLRSYYKMIEGDVIDRIIQHISSKQGIDIQSQIKCDLRAR